MSDKKRSRYNRIRVQLKDLFGKNDDLLSRMATINSVLYHKMDGFFWVGFYLLKDERLLVGPYQGPLACMELGRNKGVCWAGINNGEAVVVPDVHKFPGHIACDSRSNSEIVIPVKDPGNRIIAVLDIDSKLKDHFDTVDTEELQQIVAMLYDQV